MARPFSTRVQLRPAAALILSIWFFACSGESPAPPQGVPSAGGAAGSPPDSSAGAGGSSAGAGGGSVDDAAAEVATPEPSRDSAGIADAANEPVVDGSSPQSDARRDAADAADASTSIVTDGSGPPARVLLYHFSTAVIDTVPAQLTFLKSKLAEWHFETDDSVDPAVFTDANLSRYAAVAMINTCFEPFGAGKPDRPQSEALQRFVRSGGGLFGTHCAAVTFASANPPALYNQVFGGRGGSGFFDGRSDCRKTADHVTTAGLPATFVFNGNLDNADFVAPDSVVLVRCTWSTGKDVAVSWYRNEGLGRVFYTNFAKVDADLKSATLGTGHVVPGLAWVLGR